MRIRHYLYLILLLICLPVMADKPLVYVDAWQKSPYVFANDEGEPEGFNVELMRRIMERLKEPYEIQLFNQHEAHEKLKKGYADISFGVKANYNATFGSFGKETVCLFENAMLVKRSDSTSVLTLDQLKNKRLTVREGSRAYYYMVSHGVPDSMITIVDNMEVEILSEVTNGRPTAVWNKMMLKWVINKYQLTDEYTVQPIDIPAGEYRFMSNDTALLSRLDSVCRLMKENGEIDKLVDKWMNPEKPEDESSMASVFILTVFLCISIFTLFYLIHHYRRKRINNQLIETKSLMHLMLSANDIMVWVYYPLTRRYAWMSREGKVDKLYTSYEFSKYFPQSDFNAIHSKVMEILANDLPPVDLTLQTYDVNDIQKKLDVDVHIEPLYDDYGKIYLVCGTQHNITDSKASLNRMRILHSRYQAAFNIALGGILRFDAEGYLIDINDRGCQRMGIKNKQKLIDLRFNIHDFGLFKGMDIDHGADDIEFCSHQGRKTLSDYFPVERLTKLGLAYEDFSLEGYYYTHLKKSYDREGHLLGYMMYFRDITEETEMSKKLKMKHHSVEQLNKETEEICKRRDFALTNGELWLVHYFPARRTLEIYDSSLGRFINFTQLDILEMVAEKDMKKLFKALHKVDAYDRSDIHVTIGTLIRNKNHECRHFDVDLHPLYNKKGRVDSYFGIIKDITVQLAVSQELQRETRKAHEAEHVKQNFLKNMSYSIRLPLVAMQKSIESLSMTTDPEQEMQMLTNITGNTRRLIMLSDDTLYLSRIEAGLLTEQKEETDFVVLFKEVVDSIIQEYRTDAVQYNINNLYDSLPVMADRRILTRILKEVVSLSSRYTHFGTISVRYMFRKDTLSIAIEDTGQGIPPSSLQTIFEPRIGDAYTTESQNKHLSGLEMPICKALVDMLKGSIDIDSNPGRGTTIYVSLPMEEVKSAGQKTQVS